MRPAAFIAVALALLIHASPSAQPAAPHPGRPGEILVKFRPGTAAADQADAHRQASGRLLAQIDRTGVQRVAVAPGTEVAALARYTRNPKVAYAEPNYIRRVPTLTSHDPSSTVLPGDYSFDQQWALHNVGQEFYCIPVLDELWCFYVGTPDADIDAPEAWAITRGSPFVKVAVIDSGLDYTHPDLAANYAGGYNYIDGNTDPMDELGHGTHVSGTIAAALGNQTGSPSAAEGVVGVAPDVRLLAYKVCRVDGSCDDFAIQQAMAMAVAEGARVINLSLGETAYSQSLDDAVQDAWNAGLVIVAGAGNNGTTDLFYPAALPNVISVGAFDEDHRRASFSNYGNWVDISAPGNVILSSYPLSACAGASTVPGDIGCYNFTSGTSMATPHVSGAAALVWSRPGVSTNQQVVDILLGSADPRGADTTRLDSWTIHGGLNIHDALSSTVAPNQPPIADAGAAQTVTASATGTASVTLDGRASSDPDGTIQSYQWTIGTATIASGANPTVTLATGVHTVTLTVTDNGGASATATVQITVSPAPPAVDTVTIGTASYQAKRRLLTIEARSSAAPNVTLTAYNADTGAPLGPLSYNARRAAYSAAFSLAPKPAQIRVTSSGGGTATKAVTAK